MTPERKVEILAEVSKLNEEVDHLIVELNIRKAVEIHFQLERLIREVEKSTKRSYAGEFPEIAVVAKKLVEEIFGLDTEPVKQPTVDAWKQDSDLRKKYTKEWLVRRDIRVRGLAINRTVELGLGEIDTGKFADMNFMTFKVTERNVSTMREVAQTLIEACDFVEKSNPTWASKMGDTIDEVS